ncbi:hypothetical protein K438DRAFT_1849818, partial [Mycena galopus ATCC 62051]
MGTAAVLSAGVEERGAAWKNPRRGRGDYRRRGGRRAIEVLERAAGGGSVLALRLTRPRSTRVAHAAGPTMSLEASVLCYAVSTRIRDAAAWRGRGSDRTGRHGLQRLLAVRTSSLHSAPTTCAQPARPRL